MKKSIAYFLLAFAAIALLSSAAQFETPSKNLVYTFGKKVVLNDTLQVKGLTLSKYDTLVRTVPIAKDSVQLYYGTTVLEPAGTLDTLCFKFPSTAYNNQKVYVHTTKALTVVLYNSTAFPTGDNPATLAANGTLSWVYLASASKWYRRQ